MLAGKGEKPDGILRKRKTYLGEKEDLGGGQARTSRSIRKNSGHQEREAA